MHSKGQDHTHLTPQIVRPTITEYDPKTNVARTEVADLVLTKYKCEKNGVPITVVAGSTTPLVEKAAIDEEEGMLYNPFENRRLRHPTSNSQTLAHLLKGSLGSGILAMPLAFYNSGLGFGLFATFIIGFICTYCVHMLVKCSHILCRRMQVPSLGFAEVAETAFLAGPTTVQKFSGLARAMINIFLVVDLLGCCCVYLVFVAKNLEQVVHIYTGTHWDIRLYMVAMLPILIALNMVRNLKYMSPFSMIANGLIFCGLAITFYYIFRGLPDISTRPNFSSWQQLPLFFGTVIFALEGIGVVMPLENNMKTPQHFLGCPGVLNIGMFVVIILYSTVGFCGYLKYGSETEGSITLNLPTDEVLAQSVKIMIAVAIFLTYSLQFYVPMEIIWKAYGDRFGSHKVLAERIVRAILVSGTVGIAVAVPNLGPLISLVGAVCLSTLGLMFPAIIELVTYWESPGLGSYNWRLWKNLFIIMFGVLGFVTGTWCSIQEMIAEYGTTK